MSASFYDLLKYAKTGIASSDMTAYDKMRAVAMAGGKVKTLTGVPPLSFTGNGKPLISWSMLGNSVQNGTPAPDAPVDVVRCGERTANMAYDVVVGTDEGAYANALLFKADLQPSTQYKLSFRASAGINLYLNENVFELQANFTTVEGINVVSCKTKSSIDVTQGAQGLNGRWRVLKNSARQTVMLDFTDIMLNLGSTPLPYEPYGYKIPITCAGQTMPIYLGQTQSTRRIKKLVMTGEENWFATGGGDTLVYNTSLNVFGVLDPTAESICTHLEYGDRYTQGQYDIGSSGAMRISAKGFTSLSALKQFLVDEYTNGTPVTVWYVLATPETSIVNEPLCKIGDYADELHSADAGVSIPTAKGANTLTVDADLQPSSMTITYR